MNLDLWKIFYEVANAKNISKASKNLHISQPAITKQIKNLEDQLDCQLFIRSQKGVILTEQGEMILQDIKNGLNYLENAEQKIIDTNKTLSGSIRIGSSTTLTKTYLMEYIEEFHKKYPKVTFEISTDPTSILKEKLKKGEIDFIIAKFPFEITDDFLYTKIGYIEDIFIASNAYKELFNKEIPLKDLVNYPILLQKNPSSSRDYIENFCKQNKVKLNSVMGIASSNLLIEFSKIGYGIGFVTKQYVKKELAAKEVFEISITPKIPKRTFGVISMKNGYIKKSCQEFLRQIMKTAK